jgi:hypothetical protein
MVMSSLSTHQDRCVVRSTRRPTSLRLGARVTMAVVIMIAATASTASGQWSRQHASTWLPTDNINGEFYVASLPGVGNTSEDMQLWLTCPSFDTSEQPDGALQEVRVYVYDGSASDGVQVRACATERDGTSLSCSQPVQTGNPFTGYATLTLNAQALSQWDGNGFSYVLVRLPRRVGLAGLSWVKGIVATQ